MNCRVLEKQEFPRPAVAGILTEYFIEARLHTDGDDTPERRRAREVQAAHATSVANPWLVVLDPETGDVVAETGFLRDLDLVLFLVEALEEAGR